MVWVFSPHHLLERVESQSLRVASILMIDLGEAVLDALGTDCGDPHLEPHVPRTRVRSTLGGGDSLDLV
jgi:hypothetical protein